MEGGSTLGCNKQKHLLTASQLRKNRSHHQPVTKTFYCNNLYLVIIITMPQTCMPQNDKTIQPHFWFNQMETQHQQLYQSAYTSHLARPKATLFLSHNGIARRKQRNKTVQQAFLQVPSSGRN